MFNYSNGHTMFMLSRRYYAEQILHMIILFVMYAPIVENAAAVGRMPMAVSTVGRNFIVARA